MSIPTTYLSERATYCTPANSVKQCMQVLLATTDTINNAQPVLYTIFHRETDANEPSLCSSQPINPINLPLSAITAFDVFCRLPGWGWRSVCSGLYLNNRWVNPLVKSFMVLFLSR